MAARKLSITDLFGNRILVTSLVLAIAQSEMLVDANATFKIKPFKLVNGIATSIPERSDETFSISDYHRDILDKVAALQASSQAQA